MRRLVILFIAFFPLPAAGQASLMRDTLKINEIVVRSSTRPAVLNGFTQQIIDSSILKDYQLNNISSVISENTTLFIKNYGPGAISTTSFRGTGAGHTQLLWNDISINSPMLGQADFSQIPAGFSDEIRILNGAASMVMGNGGIGGTVNFATRPVWTAGSGFFLSGGAGSFDTWTGMIRLRTGTERFQSVTRGFVQHAHNDFKFLNDAAYSYPVMERRTNAAVLMDDLMQEFYIRNDRSVTSASVWYSNADRQLPANMLVAQSPGSETQQDESLRTVISHHRTLGTALFEASAAWFSDKLLYINKPASIYSDNRCNNVYAKAAADIPAGESNRIRLVLNNETNLVRSVNYSRYESRNIITLSATDRISVGKRLGLSVLLRDIVTDKKFQLPDFSAGADLKVIQRNDAFIRFSFSRNSKLPSMNDLYWNPGGNRSLKNEYSYTGELSFEMKNKIAGMIEIANSITFFSSKIRDMIQWLPAGNAIWTPQNIASVSTSGAEATLGVLMKAGKASMRIRLQYSYNLAMAVDGFNKEIRRQLIYVPENQLGASAGVEYGSLFATFLTGFAGRRYTQPDNSSYLPAYFLGSIVAGFRVDRGPSHIGLSLKAENIFNVRYQAIAYYPMPGRSFMLSIIYQFNKPS